LIGRFFDVDSVGADFKFRDETVPVRGVASGASNQYERRHASCKK